MTLIRAEIEVISEVLHLYRDNPCLWDPSDSNFKIVEARQDAYSAILEKYRKLVPDANKDSLKKKLDMLKSSYKRELKKILRDPNHQPSLWYFSHLKFLDKQIFDILDPASKSSDVSDDEDKISTINLSASDTQSISETLTILYQSEEDSDEDIIRFEIPPYETKEDSEEEDGNGSVLYSLLTTNTPMQKRNKNTATSTTTENEPAYEPLIKRIKPTNSTNTLHTSTKEFPRQESCLRKKIEPSKTGIKNDSFKTRMKNDNTNILILNEPSKTKMNEPLLQSVSNLELINFDTASTDNESMAFGRAIGIQLNDLSPLQKTIATKLISDVIFYGRLDRLTTQTCVEFK